MRMAIRFQHLTSLNFFLHHTNQERELSKSIDSCNVEAGVVKTWINFLEDTWQLQSSYHEQKENKTKYVVIMAIHAFYSPCKAMRNYVLHFCCAVYCS